MTNVQTKRSFGGRIWWIIRTAFVSMLFIVILGGIGWAAYYGTTELQRSFNSLGSRIDANKQRVELLNEDVADLQTEDAAGNIAALQTAVNDLQAQVDNAIAAGDEEWTSLKERLSPLETSMAEAATSAETAALGDAVVALQNDINESNGRLDSLGGEIDDVRGETEIANAAAAAAISDVELETMRQTVALFQLWEHIARARLHLAEANIGLATTEVEQTLRLMDLIVAASSEEDAAVLDLMQTRLSLAFNSLPDDPETAVLDLENAWNQLDVFLTARLYPGVDVDALLGETAVVDETDSEAEADTDEETSSEEETTSEEETATPEATPDATPEPTPTPSS